MGSYEAVGPLMWIGIDPSIQVYDVGGVSKHKWYRIFVFLLLPLYCNKHQLPLSSGIFVLCYGMESVHHGSVLARENSSSSMGR